MATVFFKFSLIGNAGDISSICYKMSVVLVNFQKKCVCAQTLSGGRSCCCHCIGNSTRVGVGGGEPLAEVYGGSNQVASARKLPKNHHLFSWVVGALLPQAMRGSWCWRARASLMGNLWITTITTAIADAQPKNNQQQRGCRSKPQSTAKGEVPTQQWWQQQFYWVGSFNCGSSPLLSTPPMASSYSSIRG